MQVSLHTLPGGVFNDFFGAFIPLPRNNTNKLFRIVAPMTWSMIQLCSQLGGVLLAHLSTRKHGSRNHWIGNKQKRAYVGSLCCQGELFLSSPWTMFSFASFYIHFCKWTPIWEDIGRDTTPCPPLRIFHVISLDFWDFFEIVRGRYQFELRVGLLASIILWSQLDGFNISGIQESKIIWVNFMKTKTAGIPEKIALR